MYICIHYGENFWDSRTGEKCIQCENSEHWCHVENADICRATIVLGDLANSRPVHSLMLSSQLSRCPPCLLPPFTAPCKMVLARPDERETWPYHCSSRLFTMVSRFSCGPIACWILARTYRGLQTNDGLLLLCQFCVRSSKEAECKPYKTKISLLNTYFAKFSLKTFLQKFTSVTFGLQNS